MVFLFFPVVQLEEIFGAMEISWYLRWNLYCFCFLSNCWYSLGLAPWLTELSKILSLSSLAHSIGLNCYLYADDSEISPAWSSLVSSRLVNLTSYWPSTYRFSTFRFSLHSKGPKQNPFSPYTSNLFHSVSPSTQKVKIISSCSLVTNVLPYIQSYWLMNMCR